MALEDLDLEFEDEEEAKRRKNDALQQDVDLEFHVPESVARTKASRPGGVIPPVTPATTVSRPAINKSGAAPQAMGEVKKLDDARAAATAQVRRPTGAPQPQTRPGSDTVGARPTGSISSRPAMSLPSDLDDSESAEVLDLRERMRKVEFEAEVKVQVAEFKAEFIGEMLGDMKLMEHQINQLLVRINAKHPDIKQEALMIKKVLAEYTTKKRK